MRDIAEISAIAEKVFRMYRQSDGEVDTVL